MEQPQQIISIKKARQLLGPVESSLLSDDEVLTLIASLATIARVHIKASVRFEARMDL